MMIKSISRKFILALTLSVSLLACQDPANTKASNQSAQVTEKQASVLIFSKTAGWRHKSIETGVASITKLANTLNLAVVATENSAIFNDGDLQKFSAVIFLSTTGDILDDKQELALERYIQAGGGFVGIHAATDTEHDWHWFGRMIGGRFKNHPKIQHATLNVVSDHAIVKGLPATFEFEDEWYNFTSLSDKRIDLITIDESSYEGGENGDLHPISWYHDFDGGRVFYTGLGHKKENYSDPLFVQSLSQGLEYAIGENITLDYKKSRPEPNRFVKKTLASGLAEPVSLAITNDGNKVLWIERKGQLHWFDLSKQEQKSAGHIPIHSAQGFGEFGLLALALDPNFESNSHAYFMFNIKYKETDKQVIQRVARFTFIDDVLDLSSEVVMMDIPSDDTCCHTGGNMEFDDKGHLYIAVGDNTNPFRSAGVGPTDNRKSRAIDDALRSSGNSQDLRGKILRIIPSSDGTYTIPAGNLFTDVKQGKPEIYVMGARNPYTLAYDNVEQTLYYGDVGPDNRSFNPERGAKGFDEINRVTAAGNFGWPLFIGFNEPYRYFDHIAEKAGDWYDAKAPVNKSPRNTGASLLPPAQAPIIAYPYGYSDKFPELGAGSRNALVAGVYRAPENPNASVNAYPAYYDGRLFISDFMRRWLKVVSLDDNGGVVKIEDFAPSANLVAPIDLKFSVNGELFILEYGSKWHNENEDARLSQIQYIGDGNRPPVAKIAIENTQGAKPFKLIANATNSSDPDNDALTYRWQVKALNNMATSRLSSLVIDESSETFSAQVLTTELLNNGKYALILAVTDANGDTTYTQQLIEVGNAPAQIDITLSNNQSFMWPSGAQYQINVTDIEDGKLAQGINASDVYVSVKTFDQASLAANVGHADGDPHANGRKAVKDNNCLGCHQLTQTSVGPAFRAIADKYNTRTDASQYLTDVIATGSTGKWGQHQMPAHDFLSEEVRASISGYILAQLSPIASLPTKGSIAANNNAVKYELSATYTDKGLPGFAAIKTVKTIQLLPSTLVLANFISHAGDVGGISKEAGELPKARLFNHGTSLPIGKYDLTSVSAFKVSQYFDFDLNNEAVLEVRTGSAKGKVIAKGSFGKPDQLKPLAKDDVQVATLTLTKPQNSFEELFLVVSEPEKPDAQAFRLGTIEFIAKN
ncbi:MAG: ThuA domain-containing protein [Thalassotalea sp.]